MLTNPLFMLHYLTAHARMRSCMHAHTHKAHPSHMWSPSISFPQVPSPPQRASEEVIQRYDDTEHENDKECEGCVCKLQGASWMKWVCLVYRQQPGVRSFKAKGWTSKTSRRWRTELLAGRKRKTKKRGPFQISTGIKEQCTTDLEKWVTLATIEGTVSTIKEIWLSYLNLIL